MPATTLRVNAPAQHRAHLTAADIDHLPNEGKGYSIVKGEVMYVRQPAYPHGRLSIRLAVRVESYVETHGLGEVVPELHVVLNREKDTVLSPDVAYFRRERVPSPLPKGYVYLIPDLVIEVLSPGNTRRAMAEKMKLYIDAGVPLGWVIDGERRTVTVHQPGVEPTILAGGQSLSGGDVIPGFEISLKDIFRVLDL